MADTAAVHTAKNHFPSFVTIFLSITTNGLMEQRSMLQKEYSMPLEMPKCCAKLSTTLDAENRRWTKTLAAPRRF